MPLGLLNTHAIFMAMMSTMQKEWTQLAKMAQLGYTVSKVIVDGIILGASSKNDLIKFAEIVLSTLQKYRATIRLRKCRFLVKSMEFIGLEVKGKGSIKI